MIPHPTFCKLKIKDLTLCEENPRSISKNAFKKLCDNIERDPDFLRNRPILVNLINGIYTVYAGNQRVRACKKLKWKEIPCCVDVDLDEILVRQRMMLDNLHNGDWDYDILNNDYDTSQLLDLGFTEQMLAGCDIVESNEDNEVSDEQQEKKKSCCPNCGFEF